MVPCLVALLACGDEKSSDITGATSVPNANSFTKSPSSSQIASLNDALDALEDTVYVTNNSLECGIACEDERIDSGRTILEYNVLAPFSGKPENKFSYKSEDHRRNCDVDSYISKLGVVSHRSMEIGGVLDDDGFYVSTSEMSSVVSVRIGVADGDTVLLETVGTPSYSEGFWGLDYTCEKYLNEFKNDCMEKKGVFKDFGDGCRNSRMMAGCAMLLSKDVSVKDIIDSYRMSMEDECKADSSFYSKQDNEENRIITCVTSSVKDPETHQIVVETNCPVREE